MKLDELEEVFGGVEEEEEEPEDETNDRIEELEQEVTDGLILLEDCKRVLNRILLQISDPFSGDWLSPDLQEDARTVSQETDMFLDQYELPEASLEDVDRRTLEWLKDQ